MKEDHTKDLTRWVERVMSAAREMGEDEHWLLRARTSAREIRFVASLDGRDVHVYEDVQTGERRTLPAKVVMSLGILAAFELAGEVKKQEKSLHT